jgi:hypothetical protein
MKALILKDDDGQTYDDYQEWITNVFLVPDDFEKETDANKFYTVALRKPEYSKLVHFKKNNFLTLKSYPVARKLYIESIKKRFEEIGFIVHER